MYVARYTTNPQYDEQRKWVGWIGTTSQTQRGCAALVMDHIRRHEPSGLWMHVHHADGLSCWRLEAETLEDALAEAQSLAENGEIDWHGFGDVTRGNVRYVVSVTDELHIFACDDVAREDW